MDGRAGRGRLSAIELLPEECAPVIAWAARELQKRDRTQTDIYGEWASKLDELKREYRGELEFDIPSFKAFNRYSIKLAALTQRMNQTREIASTLAEKFDANASDDLTILAAEAIKTLVFEILTNAGEAGVATKGAMELANALRAASQAQNVSSERRHRVQAEFEKKAAAAVEKAAKVKGLTEDTVEAIKSQILGVRREG